MCKYGIANPFDGFGAPRARRQEDVKWLDPGGYRRWRDLGVRGLDLSGRPDRWWQGRNGERDAAFCDGLYGTGLRVSEWANVVLPELPPYDRCRGYYTCELADACAKGGSGASVLDAPLGDEEPAVLYRGARTAAVRRAQAEGRYEQLDGLRLALAAHGAASVTLEAGHGSEKRCGTTSDRAPGCGYSAAAAALGWQERDLLAYEPRPLAQAYPAYLGHTWPGARYSGPVAGSPGDVGQPGEVVWLLRRGG